MTRHRAILCVVLVLAGCATPKPRPVPLTQADVIAMARSGMTDEDILRQIDATRTVFQLGAADVARLRETGLSDRVIDYMLETRVRAAAAAERRSRYYYDYPHYPSWHYGFGYHYYHYPQRHRYRH